MLKVTLNTSPSPNPEKHELPLGESWLRWPFTMVILAMVHGPLPSQFRPYLFIRYAEAAHKTYKLCKA